MTEPTPKTRRAPKGEKRREELLDAALQVFSREGYSGASVARVAAVAGLSVAGLLHHYPSKISLLMGVLQRRDEINQRIADQVRAEKTLCGLLGSLRAINAANANAPGVVRAFTILNAELPAGHSPLGLAANGSVRQMIQQLGIEILDVLPVRNALPSEQRA